MIEAPRKWPGKPAALALAAHLRLVTGQDVELGYFVDGYQRVPYTSLPTSRMKMYYQHFRVQYNAWMNK